MARIHIKSFVQPFERQLALLEIQSLLRIKDIEPDEQGNLSIDLNAGQIRLLLSKLAYVDTIDSENTFHTKLESSYKGTAPTRRILRYGPHGIHEYRGKFFPQMVRALLNISNADQHAVVLDPMCGSGTTNVVAREMGYQSFGLDMNPLSVELSLAKTELLDTTAAKINKLQLSVTAALAEARPHPNHSRHEYLKGWFDEAALQEIQHILAVIEAETNPQHQRFMKICLSNVIRDVSWQKTADLRIRKEHYDYIPGRATELFVAMLDKNVAMVKPYLQTIQGSGQRLQNAHIQTGDARSLTSTLPQIAGQVDVIITSPPYATALPYLDTDRLSLAVLDLLQTASHKDLDPQMIGNREITKRMKQELWDDYQARKPSLTPSINQLIDTIHEGNRDDPTAGYRKQNLAPLLAKYFLDMHDVLRESYAMCREGADAFFVVGSNSTTVQGEKIIIETDALLWELAKAIGWQHGAFMPMELLRSRDIFKDNRGASETILWLKK